MAGEGSREVSGRMTSAVQAGDTVYFQTELPIEYSLPYSGGLGATVRFSFSRHHRARCESCQNRRVLYSVGIGDFARGPKLCAKCAGIR